MRETEKAERERKRERVWQEERGGTRVAKGIHLGQSIKGGEEKIKQ